MGQKVLHIFLALLVFISTIGVTVNRHYCQQQLRSTGLWWIPMSCHESAIADDKLPSCPFHAQKPDSEKRKCCSEESDYKKIEIEQDFVVSKVLSDLPIILLSFDFFTSDSREFTVLENEYDIYCFHPPPERVARRVLYQIFLI